MQKNNVCGIVFNMTIAESVRRLREQIDEVNRDTKIVAATKTRTIEEIRACMETGLCLAAGENRVQELTEKFVPDFRWDFIGQLQTNKVKYVVGKAALIHSLDRMSLAEEIERVSAKRGLVQDVLIEINTGKEESKGGVFLEDVDFFCDRIAPLEHLRVRGLMAVAPQDKSEDELRRLFDGVYEKFFSMKSDVVCELSMGMTNDCLIAASCGATVVRVGRKIFGERNKI